MLFTSVKSATTFLFSFALLLGVFGPTRAFAQRTLAPTYFDRKGQKAVKSECYTYRLEKSKYSKVDTVVSYFCSTEKPHTVVSVKGSIPHGRALTYYESGNIQTRAYFDNAIQVDTVTEWYEDGKMHYQRYWGTAESPEDLIINYWDSTGVQLVKDGYGECRCIWKPSAHIETGKVKAGLKDSVWTTMLPTGTLQSSQTYENGRVVGVVRRFANVLPESVVFSAVGSTAKPVGGMGEFYKFIAQNMDYPRLARAKGIEGKVFVEFVIETDGTLSEIFVIKGIGGGCDEEAVRVISLAPPWIPGEHEGMPVRQKMVLPLNFSLDNPKTKKR